MRRWLSRRELARLAGAGALAAALRPARAAQARPGTVGTAPLTAGDLTPDRTRDALERALRAATGARTSAAAVEALFAADDVVGIKVNALAGRGMSPHVELVGALAGLLRRRGIPPDRIIVFDRSSRELRRAGFPIRRSAEDFLCYGIDNDYEATPTTSGAIGSCYARLVTARCTALVSFGVVKDHDLSGVSAGLKNWYGVIHNPNKYHDGNCDPYLADVVRHPHIRSRIRLTVLDGVVAQYHGGPAYRPDTTFPLGLVVASTDPVACDAWAWRRIDAERARRGLALLAEAGRPPRYLHTAATYGLGIGRPDQIREVSG